MGQNEWHGPKTTAKMGSGGVDIRYLVIAESLVYRGMGRQEHQAHMPPGQPRRTLSHQETTVGENEHQQIPPLLVSVWETPCVVWRKTEYFELQPT